jgi:hypothetical protein
MEYKMLSEDEIEAGKSEKGGWTRATLAEWGVSWPPPRGWKRALTEGVDPETYKRPEPESHPDSIESELFHELVMLLIERGLGDLLGEIDGINSYYNCGIPTVADIVGGRPETAIIEGGITWEDKVYRFSVARRVK